MLKPLVVILLLLAGLLAGFWLGGAEMMVRGIRLMWPDLYEEMLRRSERE